MAATSALPLPTTKSVVRADGSAVLAFAFTFLAFFPYPAMAVGNNLGLQLNQLVALGLLPLVLLGRIPWRHLSLYLGLGTVLLTAGFLALLRGGNTSADLFVKTLIAYLVGTLILVPTGTIARRSHLGPILVGASAAILIHVLVSLYQIYAFSQDRFPFAGLYQNPSFFNMQEWQDDIRLYIKRPFGLFPEPSSMVSCIGPFLILMSGVLLRGTYRQRLGRPAQALLAIATVGGVIVLFNARSGYAPLWVLSIVPIMILFPIADARPGRSRTFRILFMAVCGLGLFVVALTFFFANLNSQEVASNGSWNGRQQSIVIGLMWPTRHILDFLVGIGPGQSYPFLSNTPTADLLPAWYSASSVQTVVTVWSLLVSLFMETGALGLAFIGGMIAIVTRAILRSSERMLGSCVFGSWLAATVLTTSYIALSPIWMMLGLLVAWDLMFPPNRSGVTP